MRKNKLIVAAFTVVLLLSLFVVCNSQQTFAFTNTCYIQNGATGCTIGDHPVFSYYPTLGYGDTHVGPYQTGNFSIPYSLCCNYNGTDPTISTNFCTQGRFLSMWSATNSHVAQNRSQGAPYNICGVGYDGFSYCEYKTNNGACNTNQTLIGTIDQNLAWNSHFGAPGIFNTNVCCSFNTTITLQGVNIAQFEFWCGVADGVCPERYKDSSGVSPKCYPREDPDC